MIFIKLFLIVGETLMALQINIRKQKRQKWLSDSTPILYLLCLYPLFQRVLGWGLYLDLMSLILERVP